MTRLWGEASSPHCTDEHNIVNQLYFNKNSFNYFNLSGQLFPSPWDLECSGKSIQTGDQKPKAGSTQMYTFLPNPSSRSSSSTTITRNTGQNLETSMWKIMGYFPCKIRQDLTLLPQRFTVSGGRDDCQCQTGAEKREREN